jgi:pyridoxine 4-dehydrogenase
MTIASSMSNTTDPAPATRSGTFVIGGDLPVHRLGFGAMRITGAGIWGEPPHRDEAISVLRSTVKQLKRPPAER